MEPIKKKCFKCNRILLISEYYKHKQMRDGHLNKCKKCTKKDTSNRESLLRKDPEWVEKEKIRAREKYNRLGYRNKHKPSRQTKRNEIKRYKEKYPEKHLAHKYSRRLYIKDLEGHHWSYNKKHWKDIIYLSPKNHAKIHRYIIYDQEQFMYRRYDNNELLYSKEMHIEYINWCLLNKED